ncbi:hypothetical protein NLG97_g6203 [Lecanicillium saksenae]|uniref:Uncharacterized protein n=1 Tax=Lecanicillium saksenae TaxID=468837 RepID=A0ACC1QU46_9HYPO|nr:hypothetical protein NLG97_g6203 [Lecanicillium saksenae]
MKASFVLAACYAGIVAAAPASTTLAGRSPAPQEPAADKKPSMTGLEMAILLNKLSSKPLKDVEGSLKDAATIARVNVLAENLGDIFKGPLKEILEGLDIGGLMKACQPAEGGEGGEKKPGEGGEGGEKKPGEGGEGGEKKPGEGGEGGEKKPGEGGEGGEMKPGEGGEGGEKKPGEGGEGEKKPGEGEPGKPGEGEGEKKPGEGEAGKPGEGEGEKKPGEGEAGKPGEGEGEKKE